MKRVWNLLLTVAVLTVLLLPAGAAEPAGQDVGSVIWEYRGGEYPDCVGGVWWEEDCFCVGLLKNKDGEAEKERLLALTEDIGPVNFVWQKYSYAELRAVQIALEPYLGDSTGALGIGVDQSENYVVIDVNTANPGADAFIAECMETYGDKVVINGADGLVMIPVSGGAVESEEEPASGGQWYIWPICGLVMLLGGVGFVSLRKGKTV